MANIQMLMKNVNSHVVVPNDCAQSKQRDLSFRMIYNMSMIRLRPLRICARRFRNKPKSDILK